jgi:PAS domain S-box-containing protein
VEEVEKTAAKVLRLFAEGLDDDALRQELLSTLRSARRPSTTRRRRKAKLERIRNAIGGESAFYQQLLEALPGGIVYISTQGEVLEANAEAVHFLGLSYDELRHRWLTDWAGETYYEDGRPCPPEEYPVSRCLATGKPQLPLTLGVRQPGGAVGWATFTAVPVLEGDELQGAVVTFVDLSESKRVREALRRSQGQLEAIVQHSPDHILEVDAEGTILSLNRPAPELTLEDLLGKKLFEFAPVEYHESFRQALRTVFEEGRPRSIEVAAEIGRVYVNHFAPVFDDARKVRKALVIASDITERLRAEDERRRLEARIQQAQRLESLGVLAGGVAHDFNNLLVGILGNIELAMRKLQADGHATPLLEDARTTATRASEMTHQLLAYSGRGQLRLTAIDLNQLVTEMRHLLSNTLSPKATLQLELDPDLGSIQADAIQLRQVVLNLLTNASDALEEAGGLIHVRTGLVDGAAAQSPNASLLGDPLREEPYVLVEVRDDGAGIPSSIRERIFEPFFSTKFTGRGLGLAAVLGIVRGHDGAIAIESKPGMGTSVRVFLPHARASLAQRGEPQPPISPPRPSDHRILVIDDEHHVRQVARHVLQAQGYHVLTAEDGRSGLAMLAAEPIDLVILDLLMPDMPGEAVLAGLQERGHQIPVLLSSGCMDEGPSNVDSSLVTGFLPKPYHIDALVDAVGKALRKDAT